MAKKPKRRRRYYRKKTRRRRKKYIPILPLISASAIPFVPAADGWGSPFNDAKSGYWIGVIQNLLHGFQPFFRAHLDTGEVKMDLHVPRYLALIIGGTIASKVANALGASKIFKNLPSPFNKLKW